MPVKPRNDSEQRQSRLYTNLGTVAGRAEGNWIYIYTYEFLCIHIQIVFAKPLCTCMILMLHDCCMLVIWQCPINVSDRRADGCPNWTYPNTCRPARPGPEAQAAGPGPARGASGPCRAGRPRRRLVFCACLVLYLGYIWICPIWTSVGPKNYCKAY